MQNKTEIVPLSLNSSDHIVWMFEVRSHPDVTPFFFAPPPITFSEHVNFLSKSIENKEREYFVVYYEGKKCGYCQVILQSEHYEIGFALHPDWWGKGIGEASGKLLLDLIEKNYEKKKISLVVKKTNFRALRLYEKLGFYITNQEEDRFTMILRSCAKL